MTMTIHKTVKLLTDWNRNQKGAVIDLAEPIAETLCRKGIAEPHGWKLTKQGTKTVSAEKVASKG